MIGIKQFKMMAGVGIIGIIAAVVMPLYSAKVAEDKAIKAASTADTEKQIAAIEAETTTSNPFSGPVVDTAKQIALATPQGQIVAAVAPVVAPVAVAAVNAVAPVIVEAITPKPIRKPKPQPVAAVEPRFETITKHVCENKTVTVEVDIPDVVKPVERNVVGMLLGGAAGALLGNQIGGGNGKTLATVATAAGGAYLGDRMANSGEQAKLGFHKEQRSQQVEVCHDEANQVRVN